MEHNIKSISYYIFQLEQGNKMVTQINSAKGLEKLSDAGSIIYWNDKYPYGKPQTDEVARGSGNREYGCRRLREKLPNFSGVSFF